MEILRVKRLNPAAKLPTRGSAGAIGLDLYAGFGSPGVFLEIAPGGRRFVPTGIAVSVPAHHYARIAPRSGLALHHGINLLAGVIDPDYTGEVGVVLHNTSDAPFRVMSGDKVAQLILERASFAQALEVSELDKTARGSGGFGSTGR